MLTRAPSAFFVIAAADVNAAVVLARTRCMHRTKGIRGGANVIRIGPCSSERD
jgi:hypothetical protein